MLDISVTEIKLNRREFQYQGDDVVTTKATMPDPIVSFALRGELMSGTGTTHLLEEELAALLTLVTRIEERLMGEN